MCGKLQEANFSSTAWVQAPRLEFHFSGQGSAPKLEEAGSWMFDLVMILLEELLCHLHQAGSRSRLS
jgi:hypothetical protein